jgi:hypothetical protein
MIDITFDFYSEIPVGKDPDTYPSPTLYKYHKILWSKALPSGEIFKLTNSTKKHLYHNSNQGEFYLSSDSILHPFIYKKDGINFQPVYKNKWNGNEIQQKLPQETLENFNKNILGISSSIIFPLRQGKSINQDRGTNFKICDRFDLTLECIKLFYEEKESPLHQTLIRYKNFFYLFRNFKGYVDFFLLQDLVKNNYQQIKFWLPFDNFNRSPLPQSTKEYIEYKSNICNFAKKRGERILEWQKENPVSF